MPIELDSDGKPLVILGHGDVEVAHGSAVGADRPSELLLLGSMDGAHVIGQANPDLNGELTSAFPTGVRLRFEKPESLVVFIGKAVELLDKMMIPPAMVGEPGPASYVARLIG